MRKCEENNIIANCGTKISTICNRIIICPRDVLLLIPHNGPQKGCLLFKFSFSIDGFIPLCFLFPVQI